VKDEEVLRERNRIEKSKESVNFEPTIPNSPTKESTIKDKVTEELITNTDIEGMVCLITIFNLFYMPQIMKN